MAQRGHELAPGMYFLNPMHRNNEEPNNIANTVCCTCIVIHRLQHKPIHPNVLDGSRKEMSLKCLAIDENCRRFPRSLVSLVR